MLFLLTVFVILPIDFTTGSLMFLLVAVCIPAIFYSSATIQVGGVVGIVGAVSARLVVHKGVLSPEGGCQDRVLVVVIILG